MYTINICLDEQCKEEKKKKEEIREESLRLDPHNNKS